MRNTRPLNLPAVARVKRRIGALRWTGWLISGATAWAVPAPPAPVAAPDTNSTLANMSLEDLVMVKVLTATQVASDPFDLPFMTTVVTREDLERRLPRTFPLALDEIVGVSLQKTAHGQVSPYLRGFTGFRTLLLIDGIRLNNSVFRDGPNQYWSTVDPLALGSVEVVKGPGSVLYGSDAVGGTVNALTANPSADLADARWKSQTQYRFESAGSSHTAHTQFEGQLTQRTGVRVGGTWSEFGDLWGGPEVGLQSHTGYAERAWDTKLESFLQPHLKLSLAHQTVFQDDVWRTHSTIYGTDWEGLKHGSDFQRSYDQERHLTYAQLHATELGGFVEEARFSLSHQLQTEDQFRLRKDLRSEHAAFDVHTLGVSAQFDSPTAIGRWVYGTTYYRDWIESGTRRFRADGSFDRQEIQGPVADDSTYDLAGLFVQNQLPRLGPVDFTIGGRFDYAAAEAGRIADPVTGQESSFAKDWTSLVGSGRAVLPLDESRHWNLFAGVGQGFRAPNLSDLSRLDLAGSGQIETPSTNVTPERFVSYEGGIKLRNGRVELEAAFFHVSIQDMIIRTPTGQTLGGLAQVTKENAGDGFLHGCELQGQIRLFSQFTAFGSLNWTEGRVDTFPTSNASLKVREPLSRLMPTTGRLGLRWEEESHRYWIEGVCTLAARQDLLSSSDLADVERIPPGGTPGYAVGTLRAGWRPSPNFTLSAALENLSNEDYRVHGSGVNEPGRNLVVAAKLEF